MSFNLMMERFRMVGLDLSGSFTAERLLAISEQARERYETLSIEFPAGTLHEGRNAARELMEQAGRAAKWMEFKGLSSAMHVGPFDGRVLKRGMRVRIPVGTVLRSMHPKDRGDPVVVKRARVVTLHDFYPGYVDVHGMHARRLDSEADRFLNSLRMAEVVWAGANGYWMHAEANAAEVLEAESSPSESFEKSAQKVTA